jgi:hypothetical protein
MLVAVFPAVCVWTAGGDVTAMRPDKDVAAAAFPPLKESELTDSGFWAAGKIICGYCGRGKTMKTVDYVRAEVLTVLTKRNAVFWDDTPHGSCKNRRFGGTYCLHHKADKNWPARNNVSSN